MSLEERSRRAHLTEQEAYWRETLQGGLPLFRFLDFPRPPRQSFFRGRAVVDLDARITRGMRRLARQQNATPFVALLSAFAVLLSRYTTEEDIIIGCLIPGCVREEDESHAACFTNLVALRVNLGGGPDYRELLRRVGNVVDQAAAHRDYPYECVIRSADSMHDLSRSPVFQTMFVWRDEPLCTGVRGVTAEELADAGEYTTRCDLVFEVRGRSRALSVVCEYDTQLYHPGTIDRLLRHAQTLLAASVTDPACCLSRLPLLTETERRQLLVDWNDTYTSYPRNACIHELFEAQARQTPDAPAVLFGEQTLTYQELDHRANLLAHQLQRLGIGPGALVALWMDRSLELVVALLAILKAGGAYLPLDSSDPPERLAFLLADTRAALILTHGRCGERLPELAAPVLSLDNHEGTDATTEEKRPAPSGATPDSVAYVAFTSGSTGLPKGVCVPHRGVVRLVKGPDYARLTAEETFLLLAPLSFDAATFEIWGCLLNGARLVVFPPHSPSLADLEAVVQQYGVTTLWLTAGLFHQMVEHQLSGLQGVHQLLAGGDVLSVPHVRKVLEELPGCRLINGYGPTEGTTFTCCYPVPAEGSGEGSVPIGRPIANTQVYVLDRHQQPVPIGVPGELYIGGDGLAYGYLNRPELTAEKFVSNPFSREPGARLFRTGDRVRYRADGNLEFLGRLDAQVKIRGFRIEPGEIEAALGLHAGVQECVVVAREARPEGQQLVAYVVPGSEGQAALRGNLGPAELRRYLQAKLPAYMLPAVFVQLSALPRTPSGKVDRRALPAPDRALTEREETFVAPRTPIEEQVAEIWAELLGLERVGVYDNFLDLGGHSLLATQIVSRLQRTVGVEISMRSLFDAMTVADLAVRVTERLVLEAESGELNSLLDELGSCS